MDLLAIVTSAISAISTSTIVIAVLKIEGYK